MQSTDISSDILLDQKYNSMRLSPPASSRILYHVACKVCRDHSSGKHYGIYACDGCAGFFKRSIRRSRQYVCKAQKQGLCMVDKTHRNQCRACRLHRCFEVGMNKDAVQHERGPRNSTLRRQIAIYKDAMMGAAEMPQITHDLLMNPNAMNGFHGMSISMTGGQHTHHTLGGGYQSPVVLDLSVPRVPHIHGHLQQDLYAQTAAYINAYATRVLPPTPPLVAAEHIKETAAEHLFKNVNWIKGIKAFSELPIHDQLLLLEDSWKEFFIFALAQYLMPINFAQLLFVYESDSSNRASIVAREIHTFHDVLLQLFHLNIDKEEYEFLRYITLFRKTSSNDNEDLANNSFCTDDGSPNSSISMDSRGLIESSRVAILHENARNALQGYISCRHPNQPTRFQTLLGVCSLMDKVSNFTIEELFFRKTIGRITMVRLISDLYYKSLVQNHLPQSSFTHTSEVSCSVR